MEEIKFQKCIYAVACVPRITGLNEGMYIAVVSKTDGTKISPTAYPPLLCAFVTVVRRSHQQHCAYYLVVKF